ncbi:hypothetical protein GOP47_0000832 [Adiantum capillus-veneris]|uniref:Rab-GAP TBC domain-containing protein n=1 Tax=Adiantum capillus-veneris TaxID=13818 RepID=A0A9D4VFQ1_ADICA|nr:hypothetical protein GOP47_0000832 [Adiantum capillus-veneris]
MPASSHTSDFDSESPRNSDASMSIADWPLEPRLRGLRWRVLLGVLPSCPTLIETLRRAAADSRRRYAELRRRLIVDPHMMEDVQRGENLNVNNPLSQDPDSIWRHYFNNTELEKTIENDLTRLYPEHGSLFQGSACQSMLKRILLVWALGHTQYGYRQGMHELLAPLVYVLHFDVTHLSQVRQRYEDPFEDRFDTLHGDKINSSKQVKQGACAFSAHSSLSFSEESEEWIHKVHPDDLTLVEPDEFGFNLKTMLLGSDSYGAEGELGALLSGRFVEHDAYCMFDALLGGQNGEVALADYFLASNEGKTGMSSVLEASASMYYTLVTVDTPLYIHLVEIGVEPQYFALRWFRVLFGREFDLEMLLHLWDAIFAASYTNVAKLAKGKGLGDVSTTSTRASFISTFAVSMILYLRSTLLAAPNATVCLQNLLNFPKLVDVRSLIENAKVLRTLSEEPSRLISSSTGKHGGFFNRGRASRHKNRSRSPSFPVHTTLLSKALQQHHSGPSDIDRHRRSESYWEEKWMNSVLTKAVSEDSWADAGENKSSSESGNINKSPENSSTDSNLKEHFASNEVPPARSTNKPVRRSLFSAFWKGAAQLMSFEDRKSDADVSNSESKPCNTVEVSDAKGPVEGERETVVSSGLESSLQKEDPNGGFLSTEGGSEAGASDIWTSDDGETSCSGDEGGKPHCDFERTNIVSERISSHPLEQVECVRTSGSNSHGDEQHDCTSVGDSSTLSDSIEANEGLVNESEVKVTKGKHSKAVLQTLGQSMAESIQVIEGALSSLTMDGATSAYRERAENLSKALLNGKGHLTALSALAELRKISSVLLQM